MPENLIFMKSTWSNKFGTICFGIFRSIVIIVTQGTIENYMITISMINIKIKLYFIYMLHINIGIIYKKCVNKQIVQRQK